MIFEQHMQMMQQREKDLTAAGIKIFRVSTTERAEFKECRRRWDFGSFSRQAIEPKKPAYALSFGTAIHYGLEQYYKSTIDATPDKEPISAAEAFTEKWRELSIKTIYGLRGEEVPKYKPEEISDAYEKALTVADEFFVKDSQEYLGLGVKMLEGYSLWCQTADFNKDIGFEKVLYTEKEFAVPIPDPITGEAYRFTDAGGQIWEMWLVGRFDMIVQDFDGWVWILDHKSSKDKLQREILILDDQMTMYLWALREIFRLWNSPLTYKIAGCYYNVLRKKLPRIPQVLKTGKSLTKAKDIDTTYEVYLQAIIDNDFDPEDYQDILTYLQSQPNTFFERAKVRRNAYEIAHAGSLLLSEAIDMLNAPFIYPHFTWDCRWKCDYKDLCLAMNRNDDVSWMRESLFQKRELEEDSVYNREATIE